MVLRDLSGGLKGSFTFGALIASNLENKIALNFYPPKFEGKRACQIDEIKKEKYQY